MDPQTDTETLNHSKAELRRQIRDRRRGLTTRALSRAAAGIADQVAGLLDDLALDHGDIVAAYVNRPDEPGTEPTLDLMRERGLKVLLPVLGPELEREWGWFEGAERLSQQAPGRPPEPTTHAGGPQALDQARLVLVPALAVDTEGFRLGQGGGWYDRALLHASQDASLIGVVFPEEVVREPLPRLEHDLPVHGVLTPQALRALPAE